MAAIIITLARCCHSRIDADDTPLIATQMPRHTHIRHGMTPPLISRHLAIIDIIFSAFAIDVDIRHFIIIDYAITLILPRGC